jgi:hypothetical protein
MSLNPTADATSPVSDEKLRTLKEVVTALLDEVRRGSGDRDKRRQVEEWMKSLAEKYPEFEIERGLRDYYLAEASRLREEFDNSRELAEKLNLGRSIESFLDRAAEYERRLTERASRIRTS